jgi:hypothetical protein
MRSFSYKYAPRFKEKHENKREEEDIKKDPLELLEMESIVTEVNSSCDGISITPDIAEENFCDCKDRNRNFPSGI